MSAASRALVIALVGCSVSCDGPTLEIGDRSALLHDAAVPADAETATEFDASDASRRPRDGSPDAERRVCHDDRECLLVAGREHCNVFTGHCVECLDDRDCLAGGTCFPQGVCIGDHGHDPSSAPGNTP